MAAAKSLKGDGGWQHIALAGLTVLLSWTFAHTIFAIHYAHEYFAGPEDDMEEGLEFPGHEPPDYWDFVYYSFVIGTARRQSHEPERDHVLGFQPQQRSFRRQSKPGVPRPHRGQHFPSPG
jgi:Protein of unknown function (DUF1345)